MDVKIVGKATSGQWFNKPDLKLDLVKDHMEMSCGLESLSSIDCKCILSKTSKALLQKEALPIAPSQVKGPGPHIKLEMKEMIDSDDLPYLQRK